MYTTEFQVFWYNSKFTKKQTDNRVLHSPRPSPCGSAITSHSSYSAAGHATQCTMERIHKLKAFRRCRWIHTHIHTRICRRYLCDQCPSTAASARGSMGSMELLPWFGTTAYSTRPTRDRPGIPDRLRMYECTVCMYECMYVCMYACMDLCVYTYECMYIIYVIMHMCARDGYVQYMYVCMYVCVCMCMYMYVCM